MGRVVVGLDRGQKRDPSAVAVVEVLREQTERTPLVPPKDVDVFVVRNIGRLPLGTPYPQVAEKVAKVVWSLRKRSPLEHPDVLVEATGVGAPVVDLLRESIGSHCRLRPVTLTYGEKLQRDGRELRVGKAYMVSRLQALLQSGRIRLPKPTVRGSWARSCWITRYGWTTTPPTATAPSRSAPTTIW